MKRALSFRLPAFTVCLMLSMLLPAATDAFSSEEFKAKGLILAEEPMSWADAQAFCQQQGKRLPLINGADSLPGSAVERGRTVTINGIGQATIGQTSWSATGLPGGGYWTGTENSDDPDHMWFINDFEGVVTVPYAHPSYTDRVYCVP